MLWTHDRSAAMFACSKNFNLLFGLRILYPLNPAAEQNIVESKFHYCEELPAYFLDLSSLSGKILATTFQFALRR